MPAGPAIPGFLYFAATKYLGYTAFCHWGIARKIAPKPERNTALLQEQPSEEGRTFVSPWLAGAARTGIGFAVGAVVGLGFWKIPYFGTHDTAGSVLFFTLLAPVRIGEWWLLLRWLYWPTGLSAKQIAIVIALGILASFALDALGVLSAFALPGGMWIC